MSPGVNGCTLPNQSHPPSVFLLVAAPRCGRTTLLRGPSRHPQRLDKAFISALFRAVLHLASSVHDTIFLYTHYQMGLLEHVHKPLGDFIRRICGLVDCNWLPKLLSLLSMRFKTSVEPPAGRQRLGDLPAPPFCLCVRPGTGRALLPCEAHHA